MSIVIVALDGGPSVSEEAQRKEAELDARLEARIKGNPSSSRSAGSDTHAPCPSLCRNSGSVRAL